MPSSSALPWLSRRIWIELAIAGTVLLASGAWGARFWNSWTANGGKPQFYQSYFEPAVMIACGKGFVISQQARPQPLEDFLQQRRDTFDCRDLPADLNLGQKNLFQGAWVYLQETVGFAWRLLGISWSGMGPLFGFLFGVVITLAYAICRLGMGRILAVVCAAGLSASTAHLDNLPHLRDYAKAPFTLALILVIGIAVTRPLNRRLLLILSTACGAILGIGYGFRTDFLAVLPVWPIVVLAFLDEKLTGRLRLKAAAVALAVATFLVTSWPALTTVYGQGGCQWHVALLGLQAPFDNDLHIAPAPYDFGYAYSDVYIDWTIKGYASRANPGAPPVPFCSHEYDVQSGAYLRAIVTTFPADLMTRAYGSVLQIVELPFLWWNAPAPGWFDGFYQARADFLRPRVGWGIWIVGLGLLVVSGVSIRLGLFLLFFLAYFGGYPAIQFQTRHHFHLELITWWALGFVVHRIAVAVWSLRSGRPDWRPLSRGAARAAAFSAAGALLIVGPLGVARWYQHRRAVQLFNGYLAAPKVPLTGGELPAMSTGPWPQFLEVDLDQAACGPKPAVTFRYTIPPGFGDISRTYTIERASAAAGLTRVFLPVFPPFKSIELSDDRQGCAAGAYRLTDLQQFPLLLGVMLPPDWPTLPMHQRLRDWESRP